MPKRTSIAPIRSIAIGERTQSSSLLTYPFTHLHAHTHSGAGSSGLDALTALADQKEAILSRVEDMTLEYTEPPPINDTMPPSITNASLPIQKRDETGELRTHIGKAIDRSVEMAQLNNSQRTSLNSLLDWFFELRNLEQEKSDEFNSNEGQLFKEDNTQLIKDATETVIYLRENKKTVNSVTSTLKKILADVHKIHEDAAKAITLDLTTKVRMKDIDISKMNRQIKEAEEGVERLTKINSNMDKSMRSTDMRIQWLESSKHKNESGWADLSRTFSEKIVYLEKALAQESSKAKMMEQILREGGLELQMELKKKENGEGAVEEESDDDKETTMKLLSKIDTLADQVQSKDLEINAMKREFTARRTKLEATIKINEAKAIEKGKLMLTEIDDFKKKFIEDMQIEGATKDAKMKGQAEDFEKQVTRMRDLLKEGEQREKGFDDKLKAKDSQIKQIQASLKATQTEVEDLKAQLEAERKEVTKLGHKLESAERAADSASKGMGGELAKFEKDKEAIEEKWTKKLEVAAENNKKMVAKQNTEIKDLRAQLDEWKANNQGQENARDVAQQEAEAAANEIAGLKKALEDIEARKKLAEAQAETALEEAKRAHKKGLEEQQREIELLEEQVRTCED